MYSSYSPSPTSTAKSISRLYSQSHYLIMLIIAASPVLFLSSSCGGDSNTDENKGKGKHTQETKETTEDLKNFDPSTVKFSARIVENGTGNVSFDTAIDKVKEARENRAKRSNSTPKPLLVGVSHTNTTWRIAFDVEPSSSFRSKLSSTHSNDIRLQRTSEDSHTYELEKKFDKKYTGTYSFYLVHVDECRHAKISKSRCNEPSYYPDRLTHELSVDFIVLPEENWKCVATSTVEDLELFKGDTPNAKFGKGFLGWLNGFFRRQQECEYPAKR